MKDFHYKSIQTWARELTVAYRKERNSKINWKIFYWLNINRNLSMQHLPLLPIRSKRCSQCAKYVIKPNPPNA